VDFEGFWGLGNLQDFEGFEGFEGLEGVLKGLKGLKGLKAGHFQSLQSLVAGTCHVWQLLILKILKSCSIGSCTLHRGPSTSVQVRKTIGQSSNCTETYGRTRLQAHNGTLVSRPGGGRLKLYNFLRILKDKGENAAKSPPLNKSVFFFQFPLKCEKIPASNPRLEIPCIKYRQAQETARPLF